MTIRALQEQRAEKVAEFSALAKKEGDGTALAENERARADVLESEIAGLDSTIGRQQRAAELERRATDAEPIGERRNGAPDLSRYQFSRVLQGAMSGKLDGIEGEIHTELSRGRETRGVMVPTEIFLGERRVGQLVTPDTAGGYMVGTQTADVADRFRPALKVEGMGATVLRNLTSFLDLPNLASSGTAQWVGEDHAPTRSAVTFSKVSMGPRTVAAEYAMSRRLVLQTGTAIETLLRRDIGFLLAQRLDRAAIKNDQTVDAAAAPMGILDTAGVEKVTTETAFSDTTANLIGALDLDDVLGTRSFLTNPNVTTMARKIKDGEGRLIGIPAQFHNERVEVTTQCPDNIGVSSDKDALIYGQWSELVLGYWSAVDVLLNPYHSDVASKGGALLHAFLDADVAVRHATAFSFAEI